MLPTIETGPVRVQPPLLTVNSGDPQSEIVVLDSRGRFLQRALGSRSSFALEPGIYRVRVLTGAEFQERSIVLTGAPIDMQFAPVAISSPVPLAGTTTSHEYHMAAADSESRKSHVTDGAGSSLFFLVRDWTPRAMPEKPRTPGNPAEGLSLFAVGRNGERQICELAASGSHDLNRDSWAACTIAVAPGVYELRLELPGVAPLCQSVVASPYWQTQSFVFLRKYLADGDPVWRADLSRTSVLIGQLAGGFSPNESALRAAEVARVALTVGRQGSVGRPLMSDEIRTMLRYKFGNPIQGIYGAHLLLMETPVDLALFSEVVQNLRGLLGQEHPDVEALALQAPGAPAPRPFDHPPMLRRSWSLVVDASVTNPTLVTDSLGARNTLESSDGPWHIWRALPETGTDVPDPGLPIPLSAIETAIAEDLGVMKGVRRARQGSRGPVSLDLTPRTFDSDTAAANAETEEVPIDEARLRTLATRFAMPSAQLKRTLNALEAKLTNDPRAPSLKILLR